MFLAVFVDIIHFWPCNFTSEQAFLGKCSEKGFLCTLMLHLQVHPESYLDLSLSHRKSNYLCVLCGPFTAARTLHIAFSLNAQCRKQSHRKLPWKHGSFPLTVSVHVCPAGTRVEDRGVHDDPGEWIPLWRLSELSISELYRIECHHLCKNMQGYCLFPDLFAQKPETFERSVAERFSFTHTQKQMLAKFFHEILIIKSKRRPNCRDPL